MGRLVSPSDFRGVLVDCTGELQLSTLVNEISREQLKDVDGIILYRDSMLECLPLFLGREAPGYILRLASHKPEKEWVEKLVVEALREDFSAITYMFTIGHEDERLDSINMSTMSMLSAVCNEYELPLIVEVAPQGRRVTKENYAECVGLAARMAVEVGASVIAFPFLNEENFRRVIDAVKTPTFLMDPLCGHTVLKPLSSLQATFERLLEIGLNGIILGPSLARSGDPKRLLKDILSIAHGGTKI